MDEYEGFWVDGESSGSGVENRYGRHVEQGYGAGAGFGWGTGDGYGCGYGYANGNGYGDGWGNGNGGSNPATDHREDL